MNTTITHLILGVVLILNATTSAQAPTPAPTNIDLIEFQGLTQVSESLIRSRLESKTGQPPSKRAIARDILRLYPLGFFSNIQVLHEQRDGKHILIYKFTEEQTIGELIILGNKKLKDKDIRSALSYQQGDAFIQDAFQNERTDLLSLYKQKGFLNAIVDITIELDDTSVRITYLINEGKKARIKKVKFAGNENISTRKLRRTVKTGNGFLFISGKYKEEKFNTDLENIIIRYGDIGRLDSQITNTDFKYSRKGKRVVITIEIEEGPEYTVANLDIADNYVFTDSELHKLTRINPGQIHNKTQVLRDAAAIAEKYSSNGYILAYAEPIVTKNFENHTTTIIHNVTEDKLKYIKKITITGNSETKDQVARRFIRLTPGDRMDGTDLDKTMLQLNRSKLFGRIRPIPEYDPDDDRFINLLMDVEEGKSGNFNFGIGLNTDTGISGFGELRLNNFDIANPPYFQGGGQIFNISASIGEFNKSYRVGFTDPEFMGHPFSLGVDVFNEEFRSRGGSRFTIRQRGVRLRLGKRISENIFIRTYIGFSEISISDLETFVDPFLRELEDDETSHTLGWSITRNTANHYLDPTKGTRFRFGNEWASFGGDNDYVKFDTDLTLYYGIKKYEKFTLSINNRNAYAIPTGDKKLVPLSARFFAGGSTTVRGYDNRDVGPRATTFQDFAGQTFYDDEATGGEFRVLNTLEGKYKLNEIMRLYTFMDAGALWFDIDDFDAKDFKYSVGVGVGLQVPFLGPLRIDYGYPLNPDGNQGSGRLHLQSLINF